MINASDPSRSRRVGGLVACALAFAGLSACGGGGDDASGATTPPTAGATVVAVSDSTTAAGPASTTAAATVGDSTTTPATAESVESTEAEDTSADSCDLVSDAVAAEVLGIEIVRREGHTDGQSVSCIKGTERNNDLTASFYVSVGDIVGGAVLFDQASGEEGSEQVSGLGDGAVYLPSAGVLYIVDGADAVSVQVVKAGVPSSQQDCVTVANDVIDRLG